MLKFITLLLIISCAHKVPKENNNLLIPAKNIAITGFETSPGQVLMISIPSHRTDRVICEKKEIRFYQHEGKVYFPWGESYFSTAKMRHCTLSSNGIIHHKVKIQISEREYPSEELKVDGKRVSLNPADLERVQRERKELGVIYSQSSKAPLFDQAFMVPLDSFITSHYGKKRVFNGVRKSQHLGVDLRARTGTPIPVANDGVVVFAGHLFYSGNTVIVDHGLGIFTTYGHLSRLIAKAGDVVRQEQVIGLAGSTGRVTGPHLHWGLKIHDKWVDGMALVEQTQKINWENNEQI